MRTVLLLCVLALAGCAEPPAQTETEEPITVAVQEPSFRARATPNQLEAYLDEPDPVLRALARREIDVGTRIEPLIGRFPNYEVYRHDPFITLEDNRGVEATRLIAKDGKLITAVHGDCGGGTVFFDERTDAERGLWSTGYHAACEAQLGLVAPQPRAKP